MDNRHITQEEWTALFSTPDPPEQKTFACRALAHIASCPECALLYEKGRDAQTALRRYAASLQLSAPSEPLNSAYLAVASYDNRPKGQAVSGVLSVDIDIQGGRAVFVEDSLETAGFANRYAMNTEDGAARLEDDGGSLTLEAKGRSLKVFFSDPGVEASVRLITADGDTPLPLTGDTAQADLPDNDYCTLDIAFRA